MRKILTPEKIEPGLYSTGLTSSIRSMRKLRSPPLLKQCARTPSNCFPMYSIGSTDSGRMRRRVLVSSVLR